MSRLDDVFARLRRISTDKQLLMNMLARSLQGAEQIIADLNRDQLQSGVTAEGAPTPGYADMRYAMRKVGARQTERWDLKYTGAFYDSIRVKIDTDGIVIDYDELKLRYLIRMAPGLEFIGLTSDSLAILREKHILPNLTRIIRQYILQ